MICRVPCHKIFIAHYEHLLADPKAFIEPLSIFLQLDDSDGNGNGNAKKELRRRLSKKGRLPSRTAHKLTQYSECSDEDSEQQCYRKVYTLPMVFIKILYIYFMDRQIVSQFIHSFIH